MLRWAGCLIAAGLLFLAPTVDAQVDDETRAAARALAAEGMEAFDAEDYVEAADKLARAYKVVKVPTLGLWLARSLERTGHLVEAAERYGEATRMEVREGDVELQREAQAEAAKGLVALKSRIPVLRIRVEGAPADSVQVAVDDVDLPVDLLDAPRPVNPGTRRIVGRYGDEVVTENAEMKEGEDKTIVLGFSGSDSPALQRGKGARESRVSPVEGGDSKARNGHRVGGWIGLGVGGAGLLVGTVTGVVAIGQLNAAEDECVNRECPPSAHDDADSYNRMRTVSSVGFTVGAVGLATGVTLLVTAPRRRTARAVQPWVGPAALGVTARF